ncbi:hypothetical protein [Deinococcus multiflagellatus]|uniref:Phage tail protein n=1 Tax=Deinococcus multiflagellatus TaxID=1656887 RepID=A0ABW1ZES5_9DEIO|nr:hypothetical protein [Deinococcus multiflagellatus]MBZ9712186.1 hypothetical protein [Deinococcus multiflagellatus]
MTVIKKFGLAAFVADRASMATFGTGVQIDFAAFTDAKYGTAGKRVIPAGTIIEPTGNSTTGEYLCGPGAGTAGKPQLILKTDAEEDGRGMAASGYGAYVGGVVYENVLPDASGSPRVLANATVRAALATRFTFMKWEDRR